VGLLLVWLAVMASLGWMLASSQAASRAALVQRFESRLGLGSEFVSLYVKDLFDREHAQASSQLAGRRVSGPAFAHAVAGLGMSAAVLLDGHGRLLEIVPSKPALLGHVLTRKYAHLAAAVAGHAAVSNVVASAALALPVVALADPYTTASGRRVFSGGYDVAKTPLGVYLRQMIVTPGRHVYLLDATGKVIAGSEPDVRQAKTLTQADPRLAAAARRNARGSYRPPAGLAQYAATPVRGTSWEVVATVPDAQLYNTVNGSSHWLAWAATAALSVAGIAIILLISGLARGRKRLALFNGELTRLAHVDALTGLKNRRTIDETLRASLSAAQRHGLRLSILMIDIDHFKRINDTLGHGAGDAALCHVARVLETTLRTEDVLARWGGEEFLVVLPASDEAGAVSAADRLRQAVADSQPEFTSAADLPVTITVGVAEWQADSAEGLISRADAALYAGKTAGRNNTQLSPPAPTQTRAGREQPQSETASGMALRSR